MSINDQYYLAIAYKNIKLRDQLLSDHDTEIYKACAHCQDEKPAYCFYRQNKPGCQSGLHSWCIECKKYYNNTVKQYNKKRWIPSIIKKIEATNEKFEKLKEIQDKLINKNK